MEDTRRLLASGRYVADASLATAVFLALKLGRPLLLEGEAGVGKTEIAKVLAETLGRPPSGVRFTEAREARIEGLADLAEEHLDVDALVALARDGAPAGLPVLPPGGVR